MAPELAYIHRFEPGGDPTLPPVLLLHGTGGDENDLRPLGREIAPGAALLSPRGNVLEGNMPRFFRRFREGLFDEDDVRRRAGELANFVTQARLAYGLAQPLALGYSNGAKHSRRRSPAASEDFCRRYPVARHAAAGQTAATRPFRRSGAHPVRIERSHLSALERGETGHSARRRRRRGVERDDLPAGPWADPGRCDKGQDVLLPGSGASIRCTIIIAGEGDPCRRYSFRATKATMSVITDDAA